MLLKMELESPLGDVSLLLGLCRGRAEVQGSLLVWNIAGHCWGADKCMSQGGWSFLSGRGSPGQAGQHLRVTNVELGGSGLRGKGRGTAKGFLRDPSKS